MNLVTRVSLWTTVNKSDLTSFFFVWITKSYDFIAEEDVKPKKKKEKKKKKAESESEDDEPEPTAPTQVKKSGFAAFMMDDSDEDHAVDSDEAPVIIKAAPEPKKKNKKKTKTEEPKDEFGDDDDEKENKKKKKKKKKGGKADADEEEDELEKALAELNIEKKEDEGAKSAAQKKKEKKERQKQKQKEEELKGKKSMAIHSVGNQIWEFRRIVIFCSKTLFWRNFSFDHQIILSNDTFSYFINFWELSNFLSTAGLGSVIETLNMGHNSGTNWNFALRVF